jgi:hypothetical protein
MHTPCRLIGEKAAVRKGSKDGKWAARSADSSLPGKGKDHFSAIGSLRWRIFPHRR